MVQHIHTDPFSAVCHGGDAEVSAVGGECGEQRGIDWLGTWRMRLQRSEGLGKVAPAIDFQQQVLDTHPRQTGIDQAAQFLNPRWHRQGIVAFEFQRAVLDLGKGIIR